MDADWFGVWKVISKDNSRILIVIINLNNND